MYLDIGTEVSQTTVYCLGRERHCDLLSFAEKGAVVVTLLSAEGCDLVGSQMLTEVHLF